MELRDPYEVNYAGQRRQNAQSRNAQAYRPQKQGAQSCNVQVYNPQREGTQRHNAQMYRPQGSARSYGVQNRRAAAPRRRKRACRQMLVAAALTLVLAGLGSMLLIKGYQAVAAEPKPHEIPYKNSAGDKTSKLYDNGLIQGIPAVEFAKHPKMEENFLTLNDYSRPGETLTEVKNIFVHYTANPGTSAAQNRNYFEQQKDTHENSVSAHFIIGYDGEIIQCVPLDEIAYAVSGRNYDSVSIECCYKAEDGSFTSETYDSLTGLLVWLTDIYDLDSEDILRHYDSNGKLCPIYYTEHPDEWTQLKKDVKTARDKTGN